MCGIFYSRNGLSSKKEEKVKTKKDSNGGNNTKVAPCGVYTKGDEFISHINDCTHPLCVADKNSFLKKIS